MVLFYLLGPEIEVHCQIRDLIPCSWNVLARASKSCHPSDDTCSEDNCFQRGWCPATLSFFLPHTCSLSLSLIQCHSTTAAKTQTLSFLFTASLTHRLCHLSFTFFVHLHIILWSRSLGHSDTHFYLPHLFSFFPHFKTDDLLRHMLESFFFFIPLIQSHLIHSGQRRTLFAVALCNRPFSLQTFCLVKCLSQTFQWVTECKTPGPWNSFIFSTWNAALLKSLAHRW